MLSTKLFWSTSEDIPNRRGLSRKHIIEGAKNSLKALDHDYVDVIFCHRSDIKTPMEEICRSFDWLIRKGYTFYWGTSEWTAAEIAEAHMVCEKYNLVKPVVEQPQYNLYNRDKIEVDFRRLFQNKKLGTTVWSPLLGGVLTGKYNDCEKFPEGSRADSTNFKYELYLVKRKEQTQQSLKEFKVLADEMGCSMAQLAMAWVINNPDVSTAITGATRVEQLKDTVKALNVKKKFTKELEEKIEKIFGTTP